MSPVPPDDAIEARLHTWPVARLATVGEGGRPHKARGIMETWGRWASDRRGEGLPCGHFLAEEAPKETFDALSDFFAG